MAMSVSEVSCVSDAVTKPMIAVCPSLMSLSHPWFRQFA